MSTQAALHFLHLVRERPDLRDRVAAFGLVPTTDQLVALAREVGFACSAAELHAAFRHDWMMRWLHQDSARQAPTVTGVGGQLAPAADE